MSSNSGTSPSLIESLKINDSNAWVRLVEIYSPLVLAWCKQFGCDRHTAQDISQEVFLAASRSIRTLRTDAQPGAFRRWLWTVARNKLIDHHRKWPKILEAVGGSTAVHCLSQIPIDNPHSPTNDFNAIDPSSPDMIRGIMLRAMELMKVEFREPTWHAFWLTAIDGLSTAVVAGKLEMTPAAVRQARSRIMRRLRQELGDLQPPGPEVDLH